MITRMPRRGARRPRGSPEQPAPEASPTAAAAVTADGAPDTIVADSVPDTTANATRAASVTAPASGTEAASGTAPEGPLTRWLLLLAFVAAILFALSSYLWTDWGAAEDRAMYGTASLTVAGVLLGMLVGKATNLTVGFVAVLVLVLALAFTAGGLGVAYWKNHQPMDVTDKVELSGGGHTGHTITADPADGFGFDIDVPLRDERNTLKLTFGGTDLDPATGSDCADGSTLDLTWSGHPEGRSIRFGEETPVPIGQKQGRVRLHAVLDTGPECRLRVIADRVVADS